MGAVGTWMIDCAYTQVGKALGMPTHSYMGLSDAKVVDVQCGLESAGGTILAALAGVNMVSGAGMMDFESCQSFEKLVIDAEIIGMTKRLIAGVDARDDPIALPVMRKVGHRAGFLGQAHTREWFGKEFYIPSDVIDRRSLADWTQKGRRTAWERARDRVHELLACYQPPPIGDELRTELRRIATAAAQGVGIPELPPLPVD